MVLVDTPVWVQHLRKGDPHLEELLLEGHVVCHPFIVGELACGHIKNREEVLSLLQTLPAAPTLMLDELLHFVDRHDLMGIGIGFVDVHLLASAYLVSFPLWTSDRKLKTVAAALGISYK